MAIRAEGSIVALHGGYAWVELAAAADQNPYPFNLYTEAGEDHESRRGLILKLAVDRPMQVGDTVSIEAHGLSRGLSAFLLLLVPLVSVLGCALAGNLFGKSFFGSGAVPALLLSVAGFLISLKLISRFSEQIETAERYRPRVVEVHRAPPPGLPPGHFTVFRLGSGEPATTWAELERELNGLVGVNGVVRSWNDDELFISHDPEVIEESRLRELAVYLGVSIEA